MSTFQAIPTKFNGITYRSRTEARWAVFFDALGVVATWEPESYNLDGVWYLPDFFILAWNVFVEVKGTIPTPYEREKARKLAQASQRPVIIVIGAPGERHGEIFFPDERADDTIYAAFARCRRCDGHLIEYWSADETSWGSILLGAHKDWDRCGEKIGGDRYTEASATARSERFGIFPEAAQ